MKDNFGITILVLCNMIFVYIFIIVVFVIIVILSDRKRRGIMKIEKNTQLFYISCYKGYLFLCSAIYKKNSAYSYLFSPKWKSEHN